MALEARNEECWLPAARQGHASEIHRTQEPHCHGGSTTAIGIGWCDHLPTARWYPCEFSYAPRREMGRDLRPTTHEVRGSVTGCMAAWAAGSRELRPSAAFCLSAASVCACLGCTA